MQKRDTQLWDTWVQVMKYGNKPVVPNQKTMGDAIKFKTVV